MSRARDNANLGAQAGSGLDASDITSGALGASVTGGAGLGVSTAATSTFAPKASPAFTGTPTGITATHVGLGNVDNVADASQTSLGTVTTGTLESGVTFPGKLLASVQTFSAGATWTKPAGITAVLVYVTGGGGSGGWASCGSSASTNPTRSGGGGAGGTAIKWITSGLGSTETVTIGDGGAEKGANGNGIAGLPSSFGSHCSGSGGTGGTQGCAGHVEGGPGGVGSSGTINLEGGPGGNGAEPSVGYNHNKTSGGNGGESYWGGGGRGNTGYNTAVYAEAGVKGSGGGGNHGNQQSQNSGAGGNGYCVVWEYV